MRKAHVISSRLCSGLHPSSSSEHLSSPTFQSQVGPVSVFNQLRSYSAASG